MEKGSSMTLRATLGLAALALAACAGGPTMEAPVKAIGDRVALLEADLSAHAAEVAAAADAAAIAAHEGPHATKLTGHFEALHHSVHDLESCQKDEAAPDISKSEDAVEKLKAEFDKHRTAMANVGELAAARAEEDRYQKAMAAELAHLKTDVTALTAVAASYSCPEEH